MDNNHANLETEADKLWYQNKRFIYIAIIISIVFIFFLYFFGDNWFSSKKIFTQYDPILEDSIIGNQYSDSSNIILPNTLDSNHLGRKQQELESSEDTTDAGIFSVNTTYQKINNAIQESPSFTSQEGLFEKMLLPEAGTPDFNDFYRKFGAQSILSSVSVLKILANTSRSILLDHNDAEDLEVLEALSDSEKIVGIIIADRKGKIVYSTNRKLINSAIKTHLPEIDIEIEKLVLDQSEDQNVVVMPIFHTYGKLGTAVLVSEKF